MNAEFLTSKNKKINNTKKHIYEPLASNGCHVLLLKSMNLEVWMMLRFPLIEGNITELTLVHY